MATPPTAPQITDNQMLAGRPIASIRNQAMMANSSGASRVPARSAASGAAFERALTRPIPHNDAIRPVLASASGTNIISAWVSIAMVDAIAIQAIMEPQ